MGIDFKDFYTTNIDGICFRFITNIKQFFIDLGTNIYNFFNDAYNTVKSTITNAIGKVHLILLQIYLIQ